MRYYIDLSVGSYLAQIVFAFGLVAIGMAGVYWKKIIGKFNHEPKNKSVNKRP